MARLQALWIAVALPQAALAGPAFVDRAPAFGFVHEYTGGWEHFVGGGVAAFDCDADGFPELYAAGGASPARLLRNVTGGPGADLAFAEATPPALALTGVTGAYPVAIDSDELTDLVVLRLGENRIFLGEPGCAFRDGAAELGFRSPARWTTAFSATWEPGGLLPTLAFGNYVDRRDPAGPFEACDDNALYRPEGPRYRAPVPLAPGHCALSMLFSDWGDLGRQDLRISNDRQYYIRDGSEEMWRLDAVPRRYGEADGWPRLSIWGMGIASRDITHDGLPEVYLTSMGDQLLQYRDPSRPGPVWRDAPFAQGATATVPYQGDDGRPSTGWHAAFADVDNDGRDDLFVTKGNVDQMPDMAMADPNNLLMQDADGTFTEAGAAAGLASPARSRGAAVTDLNRDGRLDIVVVNRRAPMEVHQNVTAGTGHWLGIALRQPNPNAHLVGARIEVRGGGRVWTREVTVGGGHASGTAGFEHFGLGTLARVEVRVTAPGATPGGWMEIAANRFLRITLAGQGPRVETLWPGSVER